MCGQAIQLPGDITFSSMHSFAIIGLIMEKIFSLPLHSRDSDVHGRCKPGRFFIPLGHKCCDDAGVYKQFLLQPF
jgi:hypothetical protein